MAAPVPPPWVVYTMYVIFGVLAVAFVVAGFAGLVGGIVAIVFWVLAAICLGVAVKTYPRGGKGPRTGAQ